ncbi:MAG: YkgJ family cysteine cluster protein [Verrucomicrobia bacterium]|nr:YkgJ family cysteine cluster protein [Verrucomicrobiota bacterium]
MPWGTIGGYAPGTLGKAAISAVSLPAPNDPIPFSFSLRIGAETLDLSGSVPDGPCTVTDLMPLLHALCNAVIEAAVRQLPPPAKVSCGPGCGACCRQLVPISHSEAAWLLHEVLPNLAPDHRSRVESRIREASIRLETSGLSDLIRNLPTEADRECRQSIGLRYFLTGIPCPFLENASCSIHPQRPLACREYLVTSPADACASPTPGTIHPVSIPLKPSGAMIRLDAKATAPGWRTMMDALLDSNRAASRQIPDAIGFLKEFLTELLGRSHSGDAP